MLRVYECWTSTGRVPCALLVGDEGTQAHASVLALVASIMLVRSGGGSWHRGRNKVQ